MSQQQPMWKRVPTTKPRVYQVTPGSFIWWADARNSEGIYQAQICFSRTEAFKKAHEFAEMNSEARA